MFISSASSMKDLVEREEVILFAAGDIQLWQVSFGLCGVLQPGHSVVLAAGELIQAPKQVGKLGVARVIR